MSNIEYTIYSNTNRIKGVGFHRSFSPQEIVGGVEEAFLIAREKERYLANPLIQVRAIMHHSAESELLNMIEERNTHNAAWMHIRLNGRIPFRAEGIPYGLYYATIDSMGRGQYGNSVSQTMMSHQRALELTRKPLEVHKTPDFIIQAINMRDNVAVDENTRFDQPLFSQERSGELINRIIATNLRAFAYSHDENQRQYTGVKSIIENNPVIIAVPFDNPEEVAAIGIIEQDERFAFGNSALLEPTYYTHPQYEGKGLSTRIRHLVNTLVSDGFMDRFYQSNGTIVFNESIRYSSFILSLRSGNKLGGDEYSPMINGDLGRAYTYIGPANPFTGLMPMGLSYFHNLSNSETERGKI